MVAQNKEFNFDAVVQDVLARIEGVLPKKEKEYASNGNRFHNFDVAARIDNETPEKALWGMSKKHLVSILDMINSCEKKDFTNAHIEEKIGDMIIYLILLEGLLKRRYRQ